MTRNNGDPSDELKRLLRRIEEMDEPIQRRLPNAHSLDRFETGGRTRALAESPLIAQREAALQPLRMQTDLVASSESRRARLSRGIAVAVVVAIVGTAILVLKMPAISIVVTRDGAGDPKSQMPQVAARDPFDVEPRPGAQQSPAPAQIDAGPRIQPPRSATRNAIDPGPAMPPPALLLGAAQTAPLQSDQVWPLGLRTTTDVDAGTLVVKGLAAGTRLSVGRPSDANGWELNAGELSGAVIIPPSGFVGAMDLAIELRLAGATLDQKSMRVEWLARTTAAAPAVSMIRQDPGEVTRLLKRGEELLASGEIAAARGVFRRLADNGEPRAAFALAETYEQSTLEKLGARGLVPDTALARTWYEKARELGSADAQHRLEMLASTSK